VDCVGKVRDVAKGKRGRGEEGEGVRGRE